MLKILIADDDTRIRQMLRQTVASLASAVYEAADGGEAIAVCATERPDWVLMDVRMKPIDGLRATAAIKARFPETRVAVVTQYDDAELRAEAKRAGACAYVLKENLLELRALLTERLPQNGSGGTVPLPARLKRTQHEPSRHKTETQDQTRFASCPARAVGLGPEAGHSDLRD